MHTSVTQAPHRYSNRAFPPYKYVPGKAPHPTRDPEGHSYDQTPKPLEIFEASEWWRCDEYLYGIDLFNYGYWWEAHEALEAVWVAAGRQTETGLFIQGLIQIAVAHLKKFQGFNDVAKRMATEGLGKMKSIKGVYLGIEVTTFKEAVKSCFSGESYAPVIIELKTETH